MHSIFVHFFKDVLISFKFEKFVYRFLCVHKLLINLSTKEYYCQALCKEYIRYSRNHQLSSTVTLNCTILHSVSILGDPAFGVASVWNFGHFNRNVAIAHGLRICISSDVKQLFMCLLAIVGSLVKSLFRHFGYF